MRQRILGVDLGSYSVKVAEFERSLRSYELVGFYEQPIGPAGRQGTGGEEGEDPVARTLSRLFEEYNLSAEFLYTTLPGQKSVFRLLDLPFSNFKKIDTTIEFEMENYLPLPLEEVVIDYKILAQDKTQSKVLATYSKKGDLIQQLNRFARAELDPRFVGAEAIELANLSELGVVLPEGPFVLVDLGHEKTNVVFFVGKTLHAARTLMWGGRDLTHAVASTLKIPEAEAERIKLEMGQVGAGVDVADAMTRQVADALRGALADLIIQLKQTLLAFQQEGGEVIPAILLTGGTSRLNGIDHYLSTMLRKNVSFLDCLDIPSSRLTDSDWCRPVAATALATAAHGVLGVRTGDIQFRRGEFAYRGEMKDLKGLVTEVGVQIGIITLFVLVTFFVSYAGLRGKIRSEKERIATTAAEVLSELPKKSLGNPKDVLSILSGRVNEAAEKKRKLAEETASMALELLKEISRSLPSREQLTLDIDDMTIASGRIRLSGRTSSFEAVDQIKTALAQSPLFQNVATENVRKGVGDQIKFDISLERKGEEVARGP